VSEYGSENGAGDGGAGGGDVAEADPGAWLEALDALVSLVVKVYTNPGCSV
jgi:hypothetical protein